MRIEIFINSKADSVSEVLRELLRKVNTMSETQEQLVADLTEIKATVDKVAVESASTLAKVTELEAELANLEVPQAVTDLVAGIKAGVIAIDDLVPDATA